MYDPWIESYHSGVTRLIDMTWKQALKKQGISHENWIQSSEVFSGPRTAN